MAHQYTGEFYTKTNWRNEPDTATPLGQDNLNHAETGIKTADTRIYELDGRIGVYEDYQDVIVGYVEDCEDYADSASSSASASASSASTASTQATLSGNYATNSQTYSRDSEAWARGTRNGTDVSSTDVTYHNNSKYYSEQAQSIVDNFTINNETPTFTEASTRTNINSGETISTIFGKIKKWFTNLKTVAFTGSASDVSFDNTGTTSSSTTVQAGLVEALSATVPTASDVTYTNTTSELSATNVQSAIDEIDSEIDTTKQIVYGICAAISSGYSLTTNYRVLCYGNYITYNDAVRTSSLHKGVLYKVTITGTCSDVSNDIEAALVLKTSNDISSVDVDGVVWAIGKTSISGTSFIIETYLSIPKTTSPTYCQYWFRKSSSSTSTTINNIYAKWEEVCVNEAKDIGDWDIQNRISNIEYKTTASQAYSVGEYLTQGGNLKKVTSAIASGNIISSSNTSDTTVGAELNKVTQTATSTNSNYDLLFSSSAANDTTATEGARKSSTLVYNPNTHIITVGSSTDTASDIKTGDGISLRTINSNLTDKCPKWETVATVSSLAAAGTTISLAWSSCSGKRIRIYSYSGNKYCVLDGTWGYDGTYAKRGGTTWEPDSATKWGFTLYWENINTASCLVKYFLNNTAAAFPTSFTIQVCKDY